MRGDPLAHREYLLRATWRNVWVRDPEPPPPTGLRALLRKVIGPAERVPPGHLEHQYRGPHRYERLDILRRTHATVRAHLRDAAPLPVPRPAYVCLWCHGSGNMRVIQAVHYGTWGGETVSEWRPCRCGKRPLE